jgi:hypothetical protein
LLRIEPIKKEESFSLQSDLNDVKSALGGNAQKKISLFRAKKMSDII